MVMRRENRYWRYPVIFLVACGPVGRGWTWHGIYQVATLVSRELAWSRNAWWALSLAKQYKLGVVSTNGSGVVIRVELPNAAAGM
jgi:hypothetical protein